MSGDTLRTEEQARRIAASLARLHAAPRFQMDFDMFRIAEGYLRVCDERGIRIPDTYRDRADHVARMERALAIDPVASVPCHNDLLAENYIDDGQQLWIIDFEYSGNNDPCFELGDTPRNAGSTTTCARSCAVRTSARSPHACAPAWSCTPSWRTSAGRCGRRSRGDLRHRLRLLGLGDGAMGSRGARLRDFPRLAPRVGSFRAHGRGSAGTSALGRQPTTTLIGRPPSGQVARLDRRRRQDDGSGSRTPRRGAWGTASRRRRSSSANSLVR